MSTQDSVRLAKVEPIYPYTVFTDEEIEQSIPQRFEKQVRLCGDRLAIMSGKRSFTYDGLNQTVNRLARKILAVRGDTIEAVALMFEHDAGVLAAMLGVLKTGKFYLVLDPSYPSDRLAYMLADSGAELVITDSKNLPMVAQLFDGKKEIINLDHLEETLPNENLGLSISPNALAMLLYTSGSTGQPKGVAIEHRSLLNLVQWHWRAYNVTEEDRATQIASPSFDAAVWEIWPYLAAGASIHIPNEEIRVSPLRLIRWLNEERITIAFLPTLLAEAGYPTGISLTLAYPIYSSLPMAAQSLQASLKRAGIALHLVPSTRGDFWGRLLPNPENARRGEWDLAITVWTPDWFGQNNGRSVIAPLFDGRQIGQNSQNYGGYQSSVVDEAIDRATTAAREDVAEQAWVDAAWRLIDDVALVPLIETRSPYARSRRVRNCTWANFGLNCDLSSLWLADARRTSSGSR
jgi:acyl-CoA synthetase (AMP-forming)/AMP-acid ligase II